MVSICLKSSTFARSNLNTKGKLVGESSVLNFLSLFSITSEEFLFAIFLASGPQTNQIHAKFPVFVEQEISKKILSQHLNREGFITTWFLYFCQGEYNIHVVAIFPFFTQSDTSLHASPKKKFFHFITKSVRFIFIPYFSSWVVHKQKEIRISKARKLIKC